MNGWINSIAVPFSSKPSSPLTYRNATPESLLIILRRGYTICADVSGVEEEDVLSSPSVSAEVSRILAAQPSAPCLCAPLPVKRCKEKSNGSTQPAHLYLPRGRLGSGARRPLHRFTLLRLLREEEERGDTKSWREDTLYGSDSAAHSKWMCSDAIKFRSSGIKQ